MTRGSLSLSTAQAVALQFLATGSYQTVVATSNGILLPSISRVICRVTDALCFFAKYFIVFPNEVKQLQIQPPYSLRG